MEEKRGDPSEAAFLRLQLRQETLSKIEATHQQGFYEDSDFYNLVKNFFKQYLNLNYEFTVSELRIELKKIYLTETARQQLDAILDHIAAVEYLSDKSHPHETRRQLEVFQHIVENLLDQETPSSMVHFWEKLPLKNLFHNLSGHFSNHQTTTVQQKIEELLPRLKSEIQGKNFETARATYQQLMAYYGQLEEADKARYYQQINDLYNVLSTPVS